MQEIEDAGATNCVRYRGHRDMNAKELWYQICMYIPLTPSSPLSNLKTHADMSFCPHGSLQSLVDEAMDKETPLYPAYNLPEPALWSILNGLVNACLLLQYGSIEDGEAKPDWEPIVHRDLKLDNVLLDSPSSKTEFPFYPTARIVDFGLAIMTNEDDPNNPIAYNDRQGAEYWRAPEQHRYVDSKTLRAIDADKLGEKTNVWGIGAIMIRLMNLDVDLYGPSFHYREPAQPELKDQMKRFSELDDIVEWCARFAPKDRPSLRELKEMILQYTEPDTENDRARGMRTRSYDGGEELEEGLFLNYRDDEEYKIGMTRS